MYKGVDMPETLMAYDGGMGLKTEDFTDPMKDGTTIIALKYKGGILIGADGRSSSVSSSFDLTKHSQSWATGCRTNSSRSITASTASVRARPRTHLRLLATSATTWTSKPTTLADSRTLNQQQVSCVKSSIATQED
jgi:hypothetical protein